MAREDKGNYCSEQPGIIVNLRPWYFLFNLSHNQARCWSYVKPWGFFLTNVVENTTLTKTCSYCFISNLNCSLHLLTFSSKIAEKARRSHKLALAASIGAKCFHFGIWTFSWNFII